MKKLLAVVLISGTLISCQKTEVINASAPSLPVNTPKVKTETYGSGVTTYLYDAQGRQIEKKRSDGSKTEYEYLPGIVNYKIYNTSGVLQYTYKYELNAQGFCIRTTVSNNLNYEELAFFNPDNSIAKSITHINGITNGMDYFYSKGNCDSIRLTGNNGNWQSTIVKTYYTDKPNVLNDTNTGDGFFSKANMNLMKYEVYRYPDGSTNTPANYAYEYDAQGRVIKETATAGNNIGISLFTYY